MFLQRAMKTTYPAVGLMLATVLLSVYVNLCNAWPHAHKHDSFHITRRDGAPSATASATPLKDLSTIMPCSTTSGCVSVASDAPLPCTGLNGFPYENGPELSNWTITCDIDYPDQNIFPFYEVPDFLSCLRQCESHNLKNLQPPCAGFVFAPGRIDDANDCYLKYGLDSPQPATIHLIGATSISGPLPTLIPSSSEIDTNVSSSPAATGLPYISVPSVSNAKILGASSNQPTTQYLKHPMALPIKLAANLLTPAINLDLVVNYPIAGDTGSWTSTTASGMSLDNLSITPHLSRDGGKGGVINGCQIFIFCDTATYQSDNMVSFVSSSIATDSGMNAMDGKPLTLVDQVGEWQDDVGRLRGFAPMTTGEEAFNIAVSGQGYRYAVWPESSLIPLNQTHGLLYASLVYDKVNMTTQQANFTSLGNTLLVVSVDEKYGPGAQRVVNQLFHENEVSWGTLGGFRSWGSSGEGGMDGMVYVFGQVENGVLLARTAPSGIADRSSYTYWDGSEWSSGMLPNTSTSYFLDTAVMDLDVFFSPYHGTFIAVYLTPDADNTFYFRYLDPYTRITPTPNGGIGDYAENLVTANWSDPQVLYAAKAPCQQFIYAGAVHAGYFGADDVTNGGHKLLLSWTEHTCQDATSAASGYAHMTVVVTLD